MCLLGGLFGTECGCGVSVVGWRAEGTQQQQSRGRQLRHTLLSSVIYDSLCPSPSLCFTLNPIPTPQPPIHHILYPTRSPTHTHPHP